MTFRIICPIEIINIQQINDGCAINLRITRSLHRYSYTVDKPCPSCLTVGVEIDARKKINCCPRAFNHRSLSFHFRGLCVGHRKVSIPLFPYAQRQWQVCKTVAHDKQNENSTIPPVLHRWIV